VLIEQESPNDAERERLLVVLLRRDQGYALAGSNRGLLSCYQCAGAKGGDGQPDIQLERGVLLVSQLSGSRWFSHAIDRLRWNRARRRVELIGRDITDVDAATGRSSETICNYLTRECIETISPTQVDDEGREIDVPTESRSWKLPKRPLQRLEQLKNPLLD